MAIDDDEVESISIEVAQRHINYGIPYRAYYCPLALAIRDHLHCTDVAVRGTITVDDDNWVGPKEYLLSEEARQFVTDVDNGQPVKPQTLTLYVVPPGEDAMRIATYLAWPNMVK